VEDVTRFYVKIIQATEMPCKEKKCKEADR
jgi:hypothetical protein